MQIDGDTYSFWLLLNQSQSLYVNNLEVDSALSGQREIATWSWTGLNAPLSRIERLFIGFLEPKEWVEWRRRWLELSRNYCRNKRKAEWTKRLKIGKNEERRDRGMGKEWTENWEELRTEGQRKYRSKRTAGIKETRRNENEKLVYKLSSKLTSG